MQYRTVIIAALIVLTACSPADNTIRVGVTGPFSGSASWYGEVVRNGLELANDDIGSIDRNRLELVYEDTKCQPRTGVKAFRKLADTGVDVIIDAACSAVALAQAPVAEEREKLLILPTATNPKIKHAGEYVFRLMPSDAQQGSKLAAMAAQNYSDVAVVAIQNDYGTGLSDVFAESFTQRGGSIVFTAQHADDRTDFRSLITKLRHRSPDAIVLIDHVKEGTAFLRQLEQQAVDIPVLATESLKTDDVLNATGTAGLQLIAPTIPETPAYNSFKRAYKAAHGSEPPSYAAYGYDTLHLLARAMRDVGTEPDRLRQYLHDLEYNGASGNVSFDRYGEREGATYSRYEVRNGSFKRLG